MAEHQITGVRVADEGTTQEHITAYRVAAAPGQVYTDTQTNTKIISKSGALAWADSGATFFVNHGGKKVAAIVKKREHKIASGGTPKVSRWLQTVSDGYYDDNLMALDRV